MVLVPCPTCNQSIDVVIGTCHDMVDDFLCSCPPGASGPLCDANVDDCYPGACHNQGTCHDEVNGFRCDCQPGYIGPRCEGGWSMEVVNTTPWVV